MPTIPINYDRFEGDNRSNSIYKTRHPRSVALLGYGDRDYLLGSRFNDYIDGGEGADYMWGGGGNDVYVVDNVNDEVYDTPGDGTYRSGTWDTVYSTVSYTLSDNIELLVLEGNAIRGTGNSGIDNVFGNSQHNILRTGGGDGSAIAGGDGNDRIYGSNSTREDLRGDNGNDTIYGYRGEDYLNGGNGNDRLYGGYDNDYLTGNSGDDLLVGSVGSSDREIDTYKGGSGRDTFSLTANRGSYSVLAYDNHGASDYAKIEDFNLSEDRLQLVRGHSYGVTDARRWRGLTGTAITTGSGEDIIAVLENVSNPRSINPSRHFYLVS
ncbi:MAG: calcium-binding protein [Cyanobacteria bacterium P01_F01_bin.150]